MTVMFWLKPRMLHRRFELGAREYSISVQVAAPQLMFGPQTPDSFLVEVLWPFTLDGTGDFPWAVGTDGDPMEYVGWNDHVERYPLRIAVYHPGVDRCIYTPHTSHSWGTHGFGLYLPFGLCCSMFALLPVAWFGTRLARVARRRKREARKLCVSCGYDLCATPERCPECGTVRQPQPR